MKRRDRESTCLQSLLKIAMTLYSHWRRKVPNSFYKTIVDAWINNSTLRIIHSNPSNFWLNKLLANTFASEVLRRLLRWRKVSNYYRTRIRLLCWMISALLGHDREVEAGVRAPTCFTFQLVKAIM